MLPGFRFLFAAILLSMSILIFGLGAAALLRAAHEEVASIPTRRSLPEPVFAQSEPAAPTLALLRVESPVAEKAPETAAAAPSAQAEQPAEAVPVPPVQIERLAALRIDDSAEATKPETPAAAPATPTVPAAAQPPTPEATEEIKVAAVDKAAPAAAVEAAPKAAESAPAMPEVVIVPPAPESMGKKTKVAALGGATLNVEEAAIAKRKVAEAERTEIKKRQRAQRAKERRRLAAKRAQIARQLAATQQQQQQQIQPDTFAVQPTITTAPRARKR
jgi:hypothetical protein